MIVVTGATGKLGRLVVKQLLGSEPADQIVAAARSPEKADDLKALGVQVRKADYNQPDTLFEALDGARKVLLISSNDLGNRVHQHQAVVHAARNAKVDLFVYTSILHANSTPLALRHEHQDTEAIIESSGLRYVFLRNGWCSENHAAAISDALEDGTIYGAVFDGRISSAARADYAAAAVAVLRASNPEPVYELAGDTSYTLTEFAATLSEQSGKQVVYKELGEQDYRLLLLEKGLPDGLTDLLANAEANVFKGAMFDDGHQLSQLIGRPTTPIEETIAAALADPDGASFRKT